MTAPRPEGTCPDSGYTFECIGNCLNPLPECRRSLAEGELRYAEVERMVDEISNDEREAGFIERLAGMLNAGIISPREVRQIVERRMSPRLIAFPPETKVELQVSPILRDYDPPELNVPETPIVETVINRMVERGYDRDKLLHGLSAERKRELIRLHGLDDPPELNVPETEALLYNGAISEVESLINQVREDGYEPDVILTHGQAVVRAPAGEEVRRGDLVTIDEGGTVRRADGERPIGIALGGGQMRVGGNMSWARNPYGSMMTPMHASVAYGGPWGLGDRGLRDQIRLGGPARYQYNERFPKEVKAKAMKLLEKFMNAEQYTAFMGGADIELENKVKDHRLIINRVGIFKLLKGGRGEGIVMTSGSVRSYKYPLGDEIAVFLDWFRHRTVELIERWRCGTYGIVEDGKQR